MKLLAYDFESLCSCFHCICVFLLIVLGFFGLLSSTSFMVYGKCHLKASWLVRVNLDSTDLHGPMDFYNLNKVGYWVVQAH